MYVFDPVRPPLMVDEPDIRSISEEQRTVEVGRASWWEKGVTPTQFSAFSPTSSHQRYLGIGEKQIAVPWDALTGLTVVVDRHIEAIRLKRWSISDPPVRYATDTSFKITRFLGYKETDKRSVESLVSLDLKYNLLKTDFLGISGEAKTSLKITSDITTEWHEQYTEVSDIIYKAGFIYVTWTLFDIIVVKATSYAKKYSFGNLIAEDAPTQSAKEVSCAISWYQDGWKDPAGDRFSSLSAVPFELDRNLTVSPGPHLLQ